MGRSMSKDNWFSSAGPVKSKCFSSRSSHSWDRDQADHVSLADEETLQKMAHRVRWLIGIRTKSGICVMRGSRCLKTGVIVISKPLKHHSKVKSRAPAYSQVIWDERGSQAVSLATAFRTD